MSEREKDYWLYMIVISIGLLFFIGGIWVIPLVVIYYSYKIVSLRKYLNNKYSK